ncbi:MAG: sensor histidine kinase [Bacillota bacterium]
MDLKKRLILSNAAIIVIPLTITFVASFLFIFIFTRIIDVDVSYGSIKKLTRIQYEFFKADGSILVNTPEKLMEEEFQQYIASRLKSINADIIVLKGRQKVFATKTIGLIETEKCLEKGEGGFLSNLAEINGDRYIVRVIPVSFKDGEEGNVILLALAGNEWLSTEGFLLFVLVVFVISFVFTNIALILNFSKSILKPLAKLQEAAGKISGGSLDFEVIEDGDAQIRELCRVFEQMRLKLMESMYTQDKYDDSRKMLLSSISHDLKTPITSIKGYVEGILDGVANTPEKVHKYLRTVYSKSVHIDRMIDDLLLYSKLDLNQIPFDLEKTDIVKFFEDCIYEIEAELEKANIKIGLHNELQESRYVLIDRDRVRRVVINIIDNSRKYMNKDQGQIDIFLRETGSSIIVEIRDNGAGIDEKDLPYIFDRFYRADSARGVMNGSGIGLAIAKQIIEGHEGKIWARSRRDEGTSVMVSIKKYQ